MLTTSCIVFGCLLAGTAQAKWGPTGSCGIRTAEHCYATSERSTSVLASIDAADNETAIVSDWQNGAFYDQEQWVTWPNAPYPQSRGWVEAGITEGNYIDCCTAYPFYATETQTGAYHEHVASGPVASGSGQYNFNPIYDTTHNGVYHVYWSSATNTANWFEVAQYGGGRPGVIQYQEAGLEVATENNPYHAGRQEVAAGGPNPPEWSAWTGAKWSHDRGICIGSNRELGAAGKTSNGRPGTTNAESEVGNNDHSEQETPFVRFGIGACHMRCPSCGHVHRRQSWTVRRTHDELPGTDRH